MWMQTVKLPWLVDRENARLACAKPWVQCPAPHKLRVVGTLVILVVKREKNRRISSLKSSLHRAS